LAKAGKYIFEPAEKSMNENVLRFWQGKVKLLPSSIDDKNAAVLGAAALVWKEVKK